MTGARVSSGTALSLLYLEDAEVSQLYLLSSYQCLGNTIKGFLYHLLYIYLFEVGLVRDLEDNIFLFYSSPPFIT